MRNLFVMVCIIIFAAGCGDEGNESQSTPATSATTGSSSSTPADQITIPPGPAVSKMIDGISIVDHSRDEKEFELRRSIGGIKSIIANYREQGLDTADLEARLAELQKQLKDLIS